MTPTVSLVSSTVSPDGTTLLSVSVSVPALATPGPAPTPAPAGRGPTIAISNISTVVSDADVQAAVAALQIQVSRDFAPIYGADATLQWVAAGQTPPRGSWQLIVADTSDQVGALGYHEMTSDGRPIGYCFAKSTIADGASWSVCLSHELLEMLADPYIDRTVIVDQPDGSENVYMYEVCDAVESDALGYPIDGVLVSDFVLPPWFAPGVPGPWSFERHVSQPLELAPGGYIGVFQGQGQWTQITARTAATELGALAYPRAQHRTHGIGGHVKPMTPHSRRARRAMGHAAWRMSAA